VRLPMRDGQQAAQNVRRRGRADAGTIPSIAMTADAFDGDMEKSRAAGMSAHLSGPAEPKLRFSTPYRLIAREEMA